MEFWGIYMFLQQEVEVKIKKFKKFYVKLQVVKVEIQDQYDEYICVWQDLEEVQNEQICEFKFKYLIIENFILLEEKNKIMNWFFLDCEEEQWKFQLLVLVGVNNSQMKKWLIFVVGYKRFISQYVWVVMVMGFYFRYRVENIMFLELDVFFLVVFEMEFFYD